MTAMAKLTNLTGVRKTLSQLGRAANPGEAVEVKIADAIRFIGRPGWDVHIPPEACVFRGDNGRLSLYFAAPFSVTDGYGNLAEDYLLGLDRAGVSVTARHLWQLNPTGLQERTLELLTAPMSVMNSVGICMATPGEFGRLPTPFRIGLTMYESTDYRPKHPEWTHQINEMDMLLTPGQGEEWNVRVYREAGVRVPIRAVRGCGNRLFYLSENRWRRKAGDEFVVATWGNMHHRKSTLEMIDVFKRAFPRQKYPKCRFRIKTLGGVVGDLPPGSYHSDDPRVEIISEDWVPEKLIAFAQGADVMLYLAKGEGIGRPPREAMAMGLPLICANNTGMQPICSPDYMFPVETARWEPATIGGEWAVPDWDQAVEALRDVYRNRERARRKAQAGAAWIARYHSPTAQTYDLLAVLDSVDPMTAKSLQGRSWVKNYLPATDHTPVVDLVGKHASPPGGVIVFGPESLLKALGGAGFKARPATGPPIEVPVMGQIALERLRAALGHAPWVLLCVPSALYPVRVHGNEWLGGFHEWARLLEQGESGAGAFNVTGRLAYGGDHGEDYSAFLLSSRPVTRGTFVR